MLLLYLISLSLAQTEMAVWGPPGACLGSPPDWGVGERFLTEANNFEASGLFVCESPHCSDVLVNAWLSC